MVRAIKEELKTMETLYKKHLKSNTDSFNLLGYNSPKLASYEEESLKTLGFQRKNFLPLNTSYACIEAVYFLKIWSKYLKIC